MLGHVKLETTQIYPQVSIKKLQQIHALTHPADLPPPTDGEPSKGAKNHDSHGANPGQSDGTGGEAITPSES